NLKMLIIVSVRPNNMVCFGVLFSQGLIVTLKLQKWNNICFEFRVFDLYLIVKLLCNGVDMSSLFLK
ncbi:MAG: hypothetical protein ACQESH_06770, partial [Campylobacterota bacterium]